MSDKELYGSFKLNGSLAIHSWYPYLAGYSANFIQKLIDDYKLDKKDKILDPFCGVGTTLLVAKQNKIKSLGIDINPFTVFVSKAKLDWGHNPKELSVESKKVYKKIKKYSAQKVKLNYDEIPEIIKKCFSKKILNKLIYLKKIILEIKNKRIRNLFLLALVTILREISNCKNFSPYIQFKEKKLLDANVLEIYIEKIEKMIGEISILKNKTSSEVISGDIRYIKLREKCSFLVTSPPYLNNWDYSWITKIELYFLGYVSNELELRELLKDKLVRSSTYVLNQSDNKNKLILPQSKVRIKIEKIIKKLEKERQERKGNSKKYDIMVREYFNDIYEILRATSKNLKPKSPSLWVVGDSALYGVHVPTDKLIGEISELVGFKFEGIEVLRKRRATRHKLKLRESVVMMRRK